MNRIFVFFCVTWPLAACAPLCPRCELEREPVHIMKFTSNNGEGIGYVEVKESTTILISESTTDFQEENLSHLEKAKRVLYNKMLHEMEKLKDMAYSDKDAAHRAFENVKYFIERADHHGHHHQHHHLHHLKFRSKDDGKIDNATSCEETEADKVITVELTGTGGESCGCVDMKESTLVYISESITEFKSEVLSHLEKVKRYLQMKLRQEIGELKELDESAENAIKKGLEHIQECVKRAEHQRFHHEQCGCEEEDSDKVNTIELQAGISGEKCGRVDVKESTLIFIVESSSECRGEDVPPLEKAERILHIKLRQKIEEFVALKLSKEDAIEKALEHIKEFLQRAEYYGYIHNHLKFKSAEEEKFGNIMFCEDESEEVQFTIKLTDYNGVMCGSVNVDDSTLALISKSITEFNGEVLSRLEKVQIYLQKEFYKKIEEFKDMNESTDEAVKQALEHIKEFIKRAKHRVHIQRHVKCGCKEEEFKDAVDCGELIVYRIKLTDHNGLTCGFVNVEEPTLALISKSITEFNDEALSRLEKVQIYLQKEFYKKIEEFKDLNESTDEAVKQALEHINKMVEYVTHRIYVQSHAECGCDEGKIKDSMFRVESIYTIELVGISGENIGCVDVEESMLILLSESITEFQGESLSRLDKVKRYLQMKLHEKIGEFQKLKESTEDATKEALDRIKEGIMQARHQGHIQRHEKCECGGEFKIQEPPKDSKFQDISSYF